MRHPPRARATCSSGFFILTRSRLCLRTHGGLEIFSFGPSPFLQRASSSPMRQARGARQYLGIYM